MHYSLQIIKNRGDNMFFVSIFAWIDIAFTAILSVLGIYALVLLIKALRIYISKNS